MKTSKIINLIISSLDKDAELNEVSMILQKEGLNYDFKTGFTNKIISEVSKPRISLKNEIEFVNNMSLAFRRIALTGVAAIIILIISIFIMEGSLSVNSFIGLSDSYDESIVFLLTGN
jgi:hypothetical protein